MANHDLKICFRVDADNITGTGHLMEIVALIKSLRKRFVYYAIAIVNDNPLCLERLQPLVDQIEILSDFDIGNKELKSLISFLKKENISVFIADLLNKSAQYYRVLKKEVSKTYVILDNDIHTEISATALINFNITQSPIFYKNARKFDTEHLIGPKYVLLDEDLHNKWSELITFREKIKKIFVNQGGSDPYGLTAKILRALEKLKLEQEVIVVLGGAFAPHHRKELEDMKSNLKGYYRFYENIPLQKMHNLLFESDIALTAAGNTLYELSFFGIPSIIIGHHENHDKVASKFHDIGAAINLGIGTRIDENDISSAVKSLLHDSKRRKALFDNAHRLVDGYGTGRLADKIAKDIRIH